ncbi:MAG: heme-binding protein [Thiobacillus sp.]|jgi:uncharacterized protein GlcG (DUF336 family)
MKKLLPLALLAATLPAMATSLTSCPSSRSAWNWRATSPWPRSRPAQDGYNVSAVVIDRAGNLQVALRDSLAARHTLEVAERKAGMATMSDVDSGEFRAARADIHPGLNHINGLIVMDGALPIRAAGSLIGVVGVSGAPGGDKDRACAADALRKLEERLEFAL